MIDVKTEAERTKLSGLDGWMTLDEVGRITGKPYWQVRRWLDARGIQRRALGHSHLVRLADVQSALARHGSEM